MGCYVTKFVPHQTLQSISWGKLTFDERVILNHVVCESEAGPVTWQWMSLTIKSDGGARHENSESDPISDPIPKWESLFQMAKVSTGWGAPLRPNLPISDPSFTLTAISWGGVCQAESEI